MKDTRIAFVGTGSIASAHAFALSVLPYYYSANDMSNILRVAAASPTQINRINFAKKYGFGLALTPEELWTRADLDINTVIILSPNGAHYEHLLKAAKLESVKRIYLEKPICASIHEEDSLKKWIENQRKDLFIQVGFQFLQMSAVRRALQMKHMIGKPIHFHARYLHSGYLQKDYRLKRRTRLQPAPEGGALADLGSHALSLLVAFLGKNLEVISAAQSGSFSDVPNTSDLCTVLQLQERKSGAIGQMVASRISAGAGDCLEFELRGTTGALQLTTEKPDELMVFSDTDKRGWIKINCGNDYAPISTFPSSNVSAGWLRSLIHAYFLFLGGTDELAFQPELLHGLSVQKLIHQAVALMD
ncbi:MAG: Gfo/Idh/MocA family oxidoreductase [Chloroflexota bacterium]